MLKQFVLLLCSKLTYDISVVTDYVQDCKPEAPRHIKEAQVPKDWPKSGTITFQDYKMRYRENTPIVLNGLNFLIKAGEKLGIVGRTGSGRTLTPALFNHNFVFHTA